MKREFTLSGPQKDVVRKLSEKSTALGIYLYAKNIALIGAVFVVNYYYQNIFLLIVSILYVGARQHSLYELNHDASHGTLFKTRGLNRFMATVFSNLFFFHHPEAFSYVQWRRIHRLHHGFLFSDMDPNYVQRRLKGETVRSFTKKDIFVEMLKATYGSVRNFFFGKQDYAYPDGVRFEKNTLSHLPLLYRSFKNDPEMNQERNVKLVFYPLALGTIYALGVWDIFLLLWIVPMYTSYPAILRFMDLTDHYWTESSTSAFKNTNSARTYLWERLFVSDLNRSYHLEHHLFPSVPGSRVASLSRFLEKEQLIASPKNGLVFERKVVGLAEEIPAN